MKRVVVVLLAVALSGCVGPSELSAAETPADVLPLPEPIHDTRTVLASTSGVTLPCGEVRQCVEHPFILPREANVHATLVWGEPNNVLWMSLLRDGEEVLRGQPAPLVPNAIINSTFPEGAYVLRVDTLVMAADSWVLDVTFSEVVPWVTEFGTIGVALKPCAMCYEPTVAVDLQGRIFAADGGSRPGDARSADFGVSEDGGATFRPLHAPPFLFQAPPGTALYYADVLLQTAPSGRLYWSGMVIVDTQGVSIGSTILEGIQVAWSDDGGETWAGNVHLNAATPGSPVYYPDRQWLGFGAGETMYMTYNQAPTGIWLSRSDDAGATWSPWVRAAPTEDRAGGMSRSGPPVVDEAGTVYFAACTGTTDATLIYRSTDEGRTFSRSSVGGGCWRFPILVPRGDEIWLATFNLQDIIVARSLDGGVTFSEPTIWGAAATASPWPLPLADGSLAVAWYRKVSVTEAELVLTRGKEAPETDITLTRIVAPAGRTEPALTDFAHAALTPDGRVVLTWMDGARVMVGIEAATSA